MHLHVYAKITLQKLTVCFLLKILAKPSFHKLWSLRSACQLARHHQVQRFNCIQKPAASCDIGVQFATTAGIGHKGHCAVRYYPTKSFSVQQLMYQENKAQF